ncbi:MULTISPECIES: hypothetical protein [unclassified Pseudonocardia]|jgi:hypothetical protein|uniref:hypothetical protein n=1 Tax=unclassified Pseudonocardia TaxID=2619320 RepID=UPI0006CAF6B2|nr:MULTISPECIES: hypothetical protein [unclassified Pseudonocardia]ALE73628.1 hypothetical protein FRP1_12210 [Pseudonocardia sp. EC080625-04]ALL76838.1 hypothetical protein AD006_18765 [Pseudonocardia sp. EC080610-09]ALL83869.1 hypothetical protein AD017_26605 [Pseudonocardia sp. EC080619-01]OLM18716.1 hypothetical protein Ae707Ps1_2975 [Pseudonocardia sp. Ae707_Ps1]
MVSISVSARSLAAARLIDPEVNTAAVQAAVEAALAAERQEKRDAGRPATRREHTARREPGAGAA